MSFVTIPACFIESEAASDGHSRPISLQTKSDLDQLVLVQLDKSGSNLSGAVVFAFASG